MLSTTISVNLCNYISQLSQPIQPFLFISLPICSVQPVFSQPTSANPVCFVFPHPFSLLATTSFSSFFSYTTKLVNYQSTCAKSLPKKFTTVFFLLFSNYSQPFFSNHLTMFSCLQTPPPPPPCFFGSDVLSADLPSWRGAL